MKNKIMFHCKSRRDCCSGSELGLREYGHGWNSANIEYGSGNSFYWWTLRAAKALMATRHLRHQYNTIRHLRHQYNTIRHLRHQYNTIRHLRHQYNTIRHLRHQYNTIRHLRHQYNTIRDFH